MLLFVYGTLKVGCCNHHILKPMIKEIVSFSVSTVEKFPMYAGDSYFPYLEFQPGIGNHINGHLFEIDECYLEKLDRFEGVPTLYKRMNIQVKKNDTLYESVVYVKSQNTKLENKKLINEWIEQ